MKKNILFFSYKMTWGKAHTQQQLALQDPAFLRLAEEFSKHATHIRNSSEHRGR